VNLADFCCNSVILLLLLFKAKKNYTRLQNDLLRVDCDAKPRIPSSSPPRPRLRICISFMLKCKRGVDTSWLFTYKSSTTTIIIRANDLALEGLNNFSWLTELTCSRWQITQHIYHGCRVLILQVIVKKHTAGWWMALFVSSSSHAANTGVADICHQLFICCLIQR